MYFVVVGKPVHWTPNGREKRRLRKSGAKTTRKINVKPADKLHSKQSEANWKLYKQT